MAIRRYPDLEPVADGRGGWEVGHARAPLLIRFRQGGGTPFGSRSHALAADIVDVPEGPNVRGGASPRFVWKSVAAPISRDAHHQPADQQIRDERKEQGDDDRPVRIEPL